MLTFDQLYETVLNYESDFDMYFPANSVYVWSGGLIQNNEYNSEKKMFDEISISKNFDELSYIIHYERNAAAKISLEKDASSEYGRQMHAERWFMSITDPFSVTSVFIKMYNIDQYGRRLHEINHESNENNYEQLIDITSIEDTTKKSLFYTMKNFLSVNKK